MRIEGEKLEGKRIEVRMMREEDLDSVLEVEQASFTSPWSRESLRYEMSSNTFATYLVITVDERVVGYVGTWLILDEGHITNVAIHPDYRRQGLASDLLEALITLVHQKGCRRITLEVRESNMSAQKLYVSLGFEPFGVRKGYYSDNGEDAVIMWLEIGKFLAKEQNSKGDLDDR